MKFYIEFKKQQPVQFHQLTNDDNQVPISSGNLKIRVPPLIGQAMADGYVDWRNYGIRQGALINPDGLFVVSDISGFSPDSVIQDYYPPVYTIQPTVDKAVITADGTDTATITVTLLKDGVATSEFDGQEWYVPILKTDGTQHELIALVLTDGQAHLRFTALTKSIYTFNIQDVRPRTIAQLENLEIVAK